MNQSHVSMKVIDVNGRSINIITDNIFEEGEHEVKWNAYGVTEGIYFLNIQKAESSKTEKLIITR